MTIKLDPEHNRRSFFIQAPGKILVEIAEGVREKPNVR